MAVRHESVGGKKFAEESHHRDFCDCILGIPSGGFKILLAPISCEFFTAIDLVATDDSRLIVSTASVPTSSVRQ